MFISTAAFSGRFQHRSSQHVRIRVDTSDRQWTESRSHGRGHWFDPSTAHQKAMSYLKEAEIPDSRMELHMELFVYSASRAHLPRSLAQPLEPLNWLKVTATSSPLQ